MKNKLILIIGVSLVAFALSLLITSFPYFMLSESEKISFMILLNVGIILITVDRIKER